MVTAAAFKPTNKDGTPITKHQEQDLENRLIKIESDDMQKQILACVVGVLFGRSMVWDICVSFMWRTDLPNFIDF